MTDQRAVVLGAYGLLGRELVKVLTQRGIFCIAASRRDCDITNPSQTKSFISTTKPTVIFNCAAYTNVDKAEIEPDISFAVNATGVGNLVEAALNVDATFVHYSTDFVFSGESVKPYTEEDQASPLAGNYAFSKAAGDIMAAWIPKHFIIRVSSLYGLYGKNFLSTIPQRLRADETLHVDNSRVITPTWVSEVADISVMLSQQKQYGTYNATALGETTCAGFARHCAARLALPTNHVLDAEITVGAPRPKRVILDNTKLQSLGIPRPSPWSDSLDAHLLTDFF